VTTTGQGQRIYYLLKAVNNLRKGVSLYPSACLVMSIIEVIDSQSGGNDEQESNPTGQKAIQCVDDCLGFVDLVIASITEYDSQVKEALKVITRKKKAPIEQVEEHIFTGASTHRDTQSKLLDLLEFVVLSSNHTVTIQTKNIDVLWRIYVNSPNFTSDQVQFLQFINKRRQRPMRQMVDATGFSERGYQEVYLLSPEEQKHLFTSILCNSSTVDYQKLSAGIAKCFHTYFRLINRDEGHLDLSKRKVEVLDFERLVGMPSLWEISFDCENERARDDSRELLVDLHLRLSPAYDPKMKKEIMLTFLDRSMSSLAETGSDLSQEGSARKASSLV